MQDKIELFDGEVLVFHKPNSPNWYFRQWIPSENDYDLVSLRTKSSVTAIEKAKIRYKENLIKSGKGEKIKTISLGEAICNYEKQESSRLNRGMIKSATYDKKMMWLNNVFMHHFGESLKVNNISDKAMEEFIDIRMNRCKRKQTIRQEISHIKHFYRTYLIKNGWVFGMPEFPEFKIRKSDRSVRTDTFRPEEAHGLIRFILNEWVVHPESSKFDSFPREKVTVKEYGKKDNVVKKQREDQFRLEMHRRTMMFYAILLLMLTGLRPPHELFSLTWNDITFKRKKVQDRNEMISPINILPNEGENMMDLWHDPDIRLLLEKIFDEYMENDEGEVEISILNIPDETKTGSRKVPCLCAGLFHQIRDYLSFLAHDPAMHPDQPVFIELFGRRRGKVLDVYAFNRIFRELMLVSDLDRMKFVPYHCRHFYITDRIRANVTVPKIAKLVGNSATEIYRTYEHLFLEDELEDLLKT